MARKNATLFVVTALSLAASGASASSFPWTVNEAGFDNPAAIAHAEQHRANSARTDGSAFPWTVNEAGFENPAAMAYAEKHRIGGTRASESAIPWSVNEAGPYVADSVPTPNRPALRTAGQ